MSARPSKVPNWGRGGWGRFLREGGGFGTLRRARVERAAEAKEGGVEARDAKRGTLRGENTLEGSTRRGQLICVLVSPGYRGGIFWGFSTAPASLCTLSPSPTKHRQTRSENFCPTNHTARCVLPRAIPLLSRNGRRRRTGPVSASREGPATRRTGAARVSRDCCFAGSCAGSP